MLLHGVVTTKLEEKWVSYNIRGWKILIRICFGAAIITMIVSCAVLMKYGVNGGFWFLLAFAAVSAWIGCYSVLEKDRRADRHNSKSWRESSGLG